MISPALAHTPTPLVPERLPQHAPLAVQTRDGIVESVHYGSVIATAADGQVLLAAGEPLAPFYPRSALKPLQAVAMVRAGSTCRTNCSPSPPPAIPVLPSIVTVRGASWTCMA